MQADDELDVCVYQCTKCSKHDGANVPCTIMMGVGDIPDQCIFKHGDGADWKPLK